MSSALQPTRKTAKHSIIRKAVSFFISVSSRFVKPLNCDSRLIVICLLTNLPALKLVAKLRYAINSTTQCEPSTVVQIQREHILFPTLAGG